MSAYETTTRKIQEIFLALQLDRNFTKEEILTFYVNHLEYADGFLTISVTSSNTSGSRKVCTVRDALFRS